jgi:capsule polysaccharide modification protein KpsS
VLNGRTNETVFYPVKEMSPDLYYGHHFHSGIDLSEINAVWLQPLVSELNLRYRDGSLRKAISFFVQVEVHIPRLLNRHF